MAAVDLDSFRFGDSADLADSLLSLVMIGRKTATCWAARDGQQTFVGKQMIVRDGKDHPRIVIQTISLCQQRFSDVDADSPLPREKATAALPHGVPGTRHISRGTAASRPT